MTAPIKRGTARRLGITRPEHPTVVMTITPDLTAFDRLHDALRSILAREDQRRVTGQTEPDGPHHVPDGACFRRLSEVDQHQVQTDPVNYWPEPESEATNG